MQQLHAGPLSRADLAARIGEDPDRVSTALWELRQAGLVHPCAERRWGLTVTGELEGLNAARPERDEVPAPTISARILESLRDSPQARGLTAAEIASELELDPVAVNGALGALMKRRRIHRVSGAHGGASGYRLGSGIPKVEDVPAEPGGLEETNIIPPEVRVERVDPRRNPHASAIPEETDQIGNGPDLPTEGEAARDPILSLTLDAYWRLQRAIDDYADQALIADPVYRSLADAVATAERAVNLYRDRNGVDDE
jgi:hypothetical protein